MKVAHKQVTTITESHFASLYETMKKNGDVSNAEKIVDLYEKKQKNEFNVSFAGHFSAGKSSMINYLLDKDVLPKSPIPTSANIVKITSGEGVARIFFTKETPIEYEEPYDIDMIKDYAKDKDTINRIEISTSENILPSDCTLIDTPGIDAADDADRLMTESALHVVDVLYYVMDYNHVQSEVNLYFLQEVQQKNIPLYIVINQVDKHNERELTFEAFDNNVKQTFDQWNIFPEKIYYSSVINEHAPHNQIKRMKADLFTLLETKFDSRGRIDTAVNEIIQAHQTFLKEAYEESISQLEQEDIDDAEIGRLEEINRKIKELDELRIRFRKQFEDELNQTLKNAYVMPARLRDQAGEYLESQQKDFKIGFFNAKKKTEEERQVRLDTFLQSLQKTIHTTIQWKLRDKFMQILRDFHINDERLMEKTQALGIDYNENHLLSFIKSGATINGNYILNYTNEVSNDIKNKFRQEANQLLETIEKVSSEQWDKEKEIYEKEQQQYEAFQDVALEKSNLEQQLQEKLIFMDQQLENPVVDETHIFAIHAKVNERKIVTKEQVPIATKENKTETEERNNSLASVEKEEERNISIRSLDLITETIDKVTKEITTLNSFSNIVNDLEDKKERLNNRDLTIALFGAFSAGKSSFSNALFGEQILPVSPNPTTAVISRITPVTERYKHGTVIITLKDDDTLLNDLQTITKDLSPTENSFNRIINWIKENQIYEHQKLTKTYQSYLLAILNGYESRKNQLGKTIEITLEEFPAFVTDEAKACYIETVDLYYDCAITQKGITLVDTPGADSVNARHTNVAFDYIKQADAIIYVTYYNHAITRADRDFLIQLGRVKEAFELDKMFFIVNASDLAENDSELKLVLDYVEEQLLQFGIRHPKIFPVSSKLSLEEKMKQVSLNKEMLHFEKEFYRFIEEDLAALTIQAAIWDINRAKSTLHNFIESLQLNQREKDLHVEHLNHKRTTLKQIISNTNIDVSQERMMERIDRQLHFVLERLYIRFHDMFSEHFNPTTITGSGSLATTQLEHHRNQFIDHVGYELLQEVRAVTLRIETYMKELLKNTHEQIQMEIKSIDNTFIVPSFNDPTIDTPNYEQAFINVDMNLFAQALKIFRNTRSFFEQNQREKMKDQFYETLQPLAKEYLNEQKQVMEKAYKDQWIEEANVLKKRIELEVDAIIEQNIKVLQEVIDVMELKDKYKTIEQMMKNIHEG